MAINNNSAIFADGYALCTQIKRSGLNIQSSLEIGWKMIVGGYLGVFQAVNLANMTWVNNTCTVTIAWPQLGWSTNTAGLGDICVALQQIPDTYLVSGDLNTTSWPTSISSSQLMYPDTADLSTNGGRITSVACSPTGAPSNIEITVKRKRETGWNYDWYNLVIYTVNSTGTSSVKTWVAGGVACQPKMEITFFDDLISSALVRGRTYRFTLNGFSFANYRNFQSGSNSLALTDMYAAFADSYKVVTIASNATKGVYYYRGVFYSNNNTYQTIYTPIYEVTIIDVPGLTVSYNGTSYSTNTTINNIVNGTTAFLSGTAVSGDYTASQLGIIYQKNSGSEVTIDNNQFFSVTLTANCTYTFTPYIKLYGDDSRGTPITLTLNVAAAPSASLTLTNVSSSTNKPLQLQVSNITIQNSARGAIYGYVIGPNIDTQDNPVALVSYTGTALSAFNFNLADVYTGTVTSPSSNFTFYVYYQPNGTTSKLGLINTTITVNAAAIDSYNAFGATNANINNTTKICRNVRFVPSTNNTLLGFGTWNYTVTNGQGISGTLVSSTSLPLDFSLDNLPVANSNVTFTVGATQSQSGLRDNTRSVQYSYSWPVTKTEIGYPSTATITPNPSTISYFAADVTSQSISFTLPTSVSTTNFFDTGSNLRWDLYKNDTSIKYGNASATSFTWGNIKTNVEAAATSRYGTQSLTNILTIRVTNKFNETFSFKFALSVNYNALLSSFTLAAPGDLINGTPKNIVYTLGRTTYENLTIITYVNNTAVGSISVNATTSSSQTATFVYTPNLSTTTAEIYGVVKHGQTTIADQTSNTQTVDVEYTGSLTVTFDSLAYDKYTKNLTYAYTITDWGAASTLSSLTASVGSSSLTYLPISAPSVSATLPTTVTDSTSASAWNLSDTASVNLKFVSNDSVVTYSNSQVIYFDTPTVAYRHNQIGINTSTLSSTAAVEIHTLTRPEVILTSVDGGTIRFNPTNGTIDFSPTL